MFSYSGVPTNRLTATLSAIILNDNSLIFHSDIDECVQGLAGCDQNCTNTAGSYYCTCMDGYELESDNHTCTGNDYN